MDRLTRAFYASSAAALLSFVATIIVFLVVAAPGFSVAQDRDRVAREMPAALIVGDLHDASFRAG